MSLLGDEQFQPVDQRVQKGQPFSQEETQREVVQNTVTLPPLSQLFGYI